MLVNGVLEESEGLKIELKVAALESLASKGKPRALG